MRFTRNQYEEAIENIRLACEQLEPDGHCCAICDDSGHMAFECGFNPLVAMEICQRISADSEKLHETLHYLAGYDHDFGVQLGPAKVVMPPEKGDAPCDQPPTP